MNRRYIKERKKSRFKEIIFTHIENNIKEYLIVSIIFFIGIIIGVIFINNASENQASEISNYITSFTEELKDNKDINTFLLSTFIGISIVYLTICLRGFCLGYTISSIILSLGIRKRNTIPIIYTFVTKYFIYTMYISS